MKFEKKNDEVVVIYYPDFPQNLDAVYYYNTHKRDCIQYSTRVYHYPEAQELLRQDLLRQKAELFQRNDYWRIELYPFRFVTSLAKLGLEIRPIRALPPAEDDRHFLIKELELFRLIE
jgi:hypothetical protein